MTSLPSERLRHARDTYDRVSEINRREEMRGGREAAGWLVAFALALCGAFLLVIASEIEHRASFNERWEQVELRK